MRLFNNFAFRCLVSTLASAIATLAVPIPARAHTLTTLYSFCAQQNCTDGALPDSLLKSTDGNFYGTTGSGGAYNSGAIFELMPIGSGWTYNVLYSFCAKKKCADGHGPNGGLIIDTGGNLFGTTEAGGKKNAGIVFELSPNTKHTSWKFKTRYNFCGVGKCLNGGVPLSGLTYAGASAGAPYDGTSPLYGTASGGGHGVEGVVYELLPQKNWSETVLYEFCSKKDCADGGSPYAPVTLDSDGNLFGVAYSGGGQNFGVAFELSPVAGDQWTYKILHDFCSQKHCIDGRYPILGLIEDAAGNIFGASNTGGANCQRQGGCGLVFSLSPDGANWDFKSLYNLCAQPDCTDGAFPNSSLMLDSAGNLMGVTAGGGGNDKGNKAGNGTVFSLGSSESVLYAFCGLKNCTDGQEPVPNAFMDSAGNIYGLTYAGGAFGHGVIFQLSP